MNLCEGYCGGGEIQCKDEQDWTDQYGESCAWYEKYDSGGCPNYGLERGTNNIPAFEACCWQVCSLMNFF